MMISREQMETILNNAPAGVDKQRLQEMYIEKGYEIEGVDTEQAKAYIAQKKAGVLHPADMQQPVQEETEKKKGILRTIGEEVVKQVAAPSARTTELLTRTFAPESMAAKGYESMADSGESQNLGGVEIPSVKAFGQGGGRQIAGEALTTASYLFPYGKAAGLAGKATGKVIGGAVSGATGGYLADVGYGLQDKDQTVGEALTPGVGTAIGAAIPLAGPVVRGVGRATSKVGSEIVEAAIPISSREAQILQTYKANKPFLQRISDVLSGTSKSPVTAGSTAVTTKAGQTIPGLFGTKSNIGIQAKRAAQSLWKDVISPRLKQAEVAVDLDGFFSKVQDDIVTSTPEISRRKALLEALEAYKEDYSGTLSVTLEQLQKLKEGWAKFVPEKAYKGKPITGAINEVRNILSREARDTIYKTLGDDVRKAYIDYGNLIGLQEMGQTAMTGAKLKGGAGSFMSDIMSQAVTPVATIGGQAIYRIGKGVEFIGELGAKNLGEALGIGSLKFPGDKAIDDISSRIKGK